ncbi:MAG TPA: 3-mercaptopyruvate sulfurtransferase [Allosphingosinicella sp.]|nr:3-mercaptopyruvate sulfurtransferase [Allosphingosinicella sp.]
MDSLVSTDWLAGELGAADLRLLDATVFLPQSGRDARAEYEAEHIPGAAFMDLDDIVDPGNPLPHSFPPAHLFASRARGLGIGDGDRILVYDNSPLHSAARGWWMLRSFGAKRVAILDGGLAKWKAEGRPVESAVQRPSAGHFTPVEVEGAVADKALVTTLVGSHEVEIVDARPGARFRGEEAEPRAGVAPGHIPGSKSLPQSELFEADGTWKSGAALRAAFDAAGVDLSKPMVTTCGSGITAAVLLFGAHLLGKEDVRLYDGSWSEWGADPATPKAKGAP